MTARGARATTSPTGCSSSACRAATASPTCSVTAPSRSPWARCPATRRSRRSGRGSPPTSATSTTPASASTSAIETLATGAGVCRDFAHLGIALCRAIDIPARMVVGLPPRARPDGPARLVRGVRRRPLVHVRRHAGRAARQPGRRRPTAATPPTSPSSPSSARWSSPTCGWPSAPPPDPPRQLADFHKQNRAFLHDFASQNRRGRRWLASATWIRSPPSTSPARRRGRRCWPRPSVAVARAVRRRPGSGRSRYVLDAGDLRIDWSKHLVDDAVLDALLAVAARRGVEARRDAMFAGEHDQRHRATAPCCTPRCARRRGVGDRRRRPRRRARRARGARPDGHVRHESATAVARRDRRADHRTWSTSASAAATSARRWPTWPSTRSASRGSACRFVSQRRRRRHRRQPRRPRSGDDAVRRHLEDVHHRSRR